MVFTLGKLGNFLTAAAIILAGAEIDSTGLVIAGVLALGLFGIDMALPRKKLAK